jgi:hypothetical protein
MATKPRKSPATPPDADLTETTAEAVKAVAAAMPHVAEVDELGELEKEFAPLRPKLARLEALRAAVRRRYDDSPAARSFTARGDRFIVEVGPRGNESVIDFPALVKAIGLKAYAAFATCTLKAMRAHVAHDVARDVVRVEAVGYRPLKVTEKASRI